MKSSTFVSLSFWLALAITNFLSAMSLVIHDNNSWKIVLCAFVSAGCFAGAIDDIIKQFKKLNE
jgi:hypothetical protein